MKASHGFALDVGPDAVVAYLADPLNIGVSNRRGRVLQRSVDIGPGSWAVIATGGTRTRIDYIVFDPPRQVTVGLTHSGFGSGGQEGTWEYQIATTPEGAGCRVRVEIESPPRATDAIAALLLPIMWWQLGRHLGALT